MSKPMIVCHGGAGHTAKDQPGVDLAADAAWAILSSGGSALEAVLAAVEIMEDDPQATYSVMVERVPRECRADAALKAYFEHLFPGEVVCATIALADLGDLEKVLAERRSVLDALEHLRLEEEATGTAPQERLNLREGSYELVEAIPWYEAKLARLDERRRDLAAEIHKRSAEVEREATGTFFDRILATPQNLSTFGEGGDDKEDKASGEGERERDRAVVKTSGSRSMPYP